jgi:hypothetical protein
MYKITATRRELLDVLHGSYPSQLELRDHEDDASRYTIIWDRDEPDGMLPSAILIPERDQADFLAWAYTYLSSMRPFTAFVRLLDPRFGSQLEKPRQSRSLGRLAESFVGLILGEAFAHLDPRSEPRQLTPNACANTHTFALTRSVLLGFDQEIDATSRAWYMTRELTKQSVGNIGSKELMAPFAMLLRLAGVLNGSYESPSDMQLVETACREISVDGDIEASTWSRLSAAIPGIEDIRDQMSRSREDRLRAFEKLQIIMAKQSDNNNLLIAFLAGYIGSRIAPGELDHIFLFTRSVQFAPASLLWFTVCAGLQSQGQILTFLDGLGSRILRDLDQYDGILTRPRSDLSVTELRVLFGGNKTLSEFRTSSNGALSVELMPGVTTVVRWSRTMDTQPDLFDRREPLMEARHLLSELNSSLERVDAVRRRLERTLDVPQSSRGAIEKRSRRP